MMRYELRREYNDKVEKAFFVIGVIIDGPVYFTCYVSIFMIGHVYFLLGSC